MGMTHIGYIRAMASIHQKEYHLSHVGKLKYYAGIGRNVSVS